MRRSTTKWLIAVIALVLVFAAVVPTVAQASGGGTTLISGKDGKDGQDGADGITPILRINEETGEWEYSYTGGRYWTSMGVKAGSSYDADNLLNPEYINQAWYANFGDKGGGAVIWEEKTLKFTSANNYFGLNNQKFNLTVGIEVDVVWNGTVYTCIPFEQSGEIFLGNRELMVSGGSHAAVYNVPFCFTGMRDTFNMVKKSTDTAENITVKIVTHVYDTYNKLDVDYLPDEVVTTDELPALGGGTSLDVTAQPGQTIIVKEVDGNGKPTKWESAEYQPRTHWTGEAVIFEGTVEADEDGVMFIENAPEIIVGETYKICWNGVEYSCVAVDTFLALGESGGVMLGNYSLLAETGDTGEPFVAAHSGGVMNFMSMDGSTSVALSMKRIVNVPIPEQYLSNAFPYYIDASLEVYFDRNEFICNDTVKNVEAIINSGRTVMVRMKQYNYRQTTSDEFIFGYTESFIPLCMIIVSDENSLGKVLIFSYNNKENIIMFIPQEDGTYSVSDKWSD